MTTRLLALIVVYGIAAERSPSLASLAASRRDRAALRVVVWDNSADPRGLDPRSFELPVEYVSTPDNLGLSTIYNRVIRERLRPDEHLLLLDQDTQLPVDFLDVAATAIAAHPDIDLFLPWVRASGRWASPVSYLLGWGWRRASRAVGTIASRRLCAINSGMIASASYLQGDFPGYDERLRFYGTDTQFMLDYSDRRPTLCLLDAVIEHDLSFYSSTIAGRASKFVAMKSAYRFIYERRSHMQRFAVRLVMLVASIRYALAYRNAGFLKVERR